MNLIITYLILFLILLLFIKLLPVLIPVFIVLYLISLIAGWRFRKSFHTYTFSSQENEEPFQERDIKNDAIDVEYTETDEEDQ